MKKDHGLPLIHQRDGYYLIVFVYGISIWGLNIYNLEILGSIALEYSKDKTQFQFEFVNSFEKISLIFFLFSKSASVKLRNHFFFNKSENGNKIIIINFFFSK